MGRSAKEYCRPNQACDGGGMVKAEKVSPKSEESDSMKRAKAKQGAPKREKSEGEAKAQGDMMEADAGWDTIGKAGASMVQTYKAKKAAK